MKNKNIKIGFPPSTKAEWNAKIEKDLRGADYQEKLVWKTDNGFEIQPFYHPEDQKDFAYLKHYSNAYLNKAHPEYSARSWFNMPEIVVSDLEMANKEALEALNNGADGLLFTLKAPLSASNLSTLLKEIKLPFCFVCFQLPKVSTDFLQNLLAHIDESRTDVSKVQGAIISKAPVMGDGVAPFFEQLSKVGNMRYQIQPTNPKAPASEQVANALLQTVKLLEAAGDTLPITSFFEKISWGLSLNNSYFMEIARLRAARILLHQLSQLYQADTVMPQDIHLHAYTSIIMDEETKEDPYLNLLSNSSQAMAAVIGGCDGLTVLPHDRGFTKTDHFAPRIARNVSNILKEEAFLDKIADPAAGSYYIESLTDQLANSAWESFRELV